jgi:Fur family zinc uptake transcriptional regulator
MRKRQERSAEIVMDSVKTELINAHFIAHSKTIEIHGLCEHCQLSSFENNPA